MRALQRRSPTALPLTSNLASTTKHKHLLLFYKLENAFACADFCGTWKKAILYVHVISIDVDHFIAISGMFSLGREQLLWMCC